jgi:hypothetical protein
MSKTYFAKEMGASQTETLMQEIMTSNSSDENSPLPY